MSIQPLSGIFGRGMYCLLRASGRVVFVRAMYRTGDIKSGSIGVIRWGDGEMGGWEDREIGRWGDRGMGKYLVMVEDGTFFYTELNGFDMKSGNSGTRKREKADELRNNVSHTW